MESFVYRCLITGLSAWPSAAHSRVHNPLIEPAVKDVIALGWSIRKSSHIHTACHSFSWKCKCDNNCDKKMSIEVLTVFCFTSLIVCKALPVRYSQSGYKAWHFILLSLLTVLGRFNMTVRMALCFFPQRWQSYYVLVRSNEDSMKKCRESILEQTLSERGRNEGFSHVTVPMECRLGNS